ncbi:MAG: hypothetical protein PHR44_02290 [Candidatus Omnitrophica bacterium]|nr:hypothetical protein [Candidatus Omnitrophota bacterium]
MENYVKEMYLDIVKSKIAAYKILNFGDKFSLKAPSKINCKDFKELIAKLENETLQDGAIVTLDGYFSNYAQMYFPLTYMPSIPSVAKIEEIEEAHQITEDIIIPRVKGNLQFSFKSFQLPIENIPVLNIENRQWKIGFLYPKEFSGFNFEEDKTPEKNKLRELRLKIPSSATPVLVLYDNSVYSQFTESDVIITAQVAVLDKALVDEFGCCLGDLQYLLQRNSFFRKKEDTNALCLILNKFTGGIKNSVKREVEGTLLLEAYFRKEMHVTEQGLSKALPNAPGGLRIANYPPYAQAGYGASIPTNKVNFVLRQPLTFSILTNSSVNKEVLLKDIELMRIHFMLFIRNICAIKASERKISLSPPDIFFLSSIYEKSLFGIDNFLKAAGGIEGVKGLAGFNETRNWLWDFCS